MSTVNGEPEFVDFLDTPHSVVGAVIVSNRKCSVTTNTINLLVSQTFDAVGKCLGEIMVITDL